MVARRHPRPPSLLAFRCVWMHAEAHCGEQRGWRMAAQAGGISQAPQNIDYRYAPIYRRYIAPNRDYAKTVLVRRLKLANEKHRTDPVTRAGQGYFVPLVIELPLVHTPVGVVRGRGNEVPLGLRQIIVDIGEA